MNSLRAVALRLIFPLPLRCATVDLFGTDNALDFFAFDFVELFLDFDGLFEEDRDDEVREPFCAINPAGRRNVTANKAIPIRLTTIDLLSSCDCDYQASKKGRQVKANS
jgi:hypothetical protein